MTRLEQAARAAWDARRKYNLDKHSVILEEWGDGSLPRANGIFEETIALLRAIREPSDEMIAAYLRAERDCTGPRDWVIRQAWPKAIDSLLVEGEK